jgi:hypothetical protein
LRCLVGVEVDLGVGLVEVVGGEVDLVVGLVDVAGIWLLDLVV